LHGGTEDTERTNEEEESLAKRRREGKKQAPLKFRLEMLFDQIARAAEAASSPPRRSSGQAALQKKKGQLEVGPHKSNRTIKKN